MINSIVSSLNDSSTTASILDNVINTIDAQNGIIVLRGLEAGPGIELTIEDTVANDPAPQKIVISATGSGSGQIYTGTNLGTSGESVFAGLTGNDFTFKTLVAGNGVYLSSDANTITISTSPTPTTTVPPTTPPSTPAIVNLGTGLPVYAGTVNGELQFNTLEAGNGITITNNGNGTLFVSSNQVITTNSGGVELFNSNNGVLEFKAITAGQNITITDGNIVTISANIPQISYTSLSNLPTIPQQLNDLNNVLAYPLNGQVLAWQELTGKWIAQNQTGILSLSQDLNPTLGGNLNVNGFQITSSNNIVLNATGNTVISSLVYPNVDGAPGQVLATNGAHELFWTTVTPNQNYALQNIGNGIGVYSQTVGSTFQLNSIAAGVDNKISVANGTNTIVIDVQEQNLNLANMGGILGVSQGGTGSTNIISARESLGLGSLATQNENAVTISGGIITVGNLTASGNVVLNGSNFPKTFGNFGQVLTTDGAGNLSWQPITASSGTTVPINSGGTGANDVITARSNLGLGNMAVQNSNAVSIIGGNISGVAITNASINTSSFQINGLQFPHNAGTGGQVLTTDGVGTLSWTSLPGSSSIINISNGGTGATNVLAARTNLGLGTLATQNSNTVSISGGNIAVSNLTTSGNTVLNGLTYPTEDGSVGQFLTTNGAGVLSWETIVTNAITPVTGGGTGATDIVSARTNLGLGSLATQNSNAVSISGGNINVGSLTVAGPTVINGMNFPLNSGQAYQVLTSDGSGNLSWQSPITNSVISIANGGTGATSAASARSNLGLGSISLQQSNLVAISGGNLSNVSINNSSIAATNLSGFGTIILNNLLYPSHDGTAGQVLTTNGNGTLSWTTLPTPSVGSSYTLETDTTPSLAGNLNLNGFGITATNDMLLTSTNGNIHANSPLMISNGNFSVIGDACSLMAVLRAQSTNSTATELFLDGISQRLTIPNNTTWMINVKVIGRRIDISNGESLAFELVGCIDNSNNNTVIINNPANNGITKIIVAHSDTDWDANVTVNSTAGTVSVFVTGETNKLIRWVAFVSIVQTI